MASDQTINDDAATQQEGAERDDQYQTPRYTLDQNQSGALAGSGVPMSGLGRERYDEN